MKDWLTKVSKFCNDVVGLPAPNGPRVLSSDRLEFYIGAVNEELDEFVKATNEGDIGEAADALIDLTYFTLGRLYEMGVPADVVFMDVHVANMTKKRGVKPERRVQHKDDAMKPEGWKPPDHSWLAHLSPTAIDAAKLLAKKARDYRAEGSGIALKDYFPFRELSHAQMVWTKALRIRSVAEQIYRARILGSEHKPNFESLRDSLIDMHNYVDFFAEDLDGGTE